MTGRRSSGEALDGAQREQEMKAGVRSSSPVALVHVSHPSAALLQHAHFI